MSTALDADRARDLTLWVLNPQNVASWIYESHGLNWDGSAAFSRTLRDFTSFGDYVDIIGNLTNRKREFERFTQSEELVSKLSPRWRHLARTITHSECDLLWQALGLRDHGISKHKYWKRIRALRADDEKTLLGDCRPPSAEHFSRSRPRRSLKHSKNIRTSTSSAVAPVPSPIDEAIVIPEPPSSRTRKRSRTGLVSSHFTPPSEPKSRRVPAGTSAVPFPPITASRFGLVQERLWNEPFKLLVAVIFLNKTRGQTAMPIYNQLMTQYRNPSSLAQANIEDISALIWHLGLQTQRAKKLIKLATTWTSDPPQPAHRYRTPNYPAEGDGRSLKPTELVTTDADLCAGALEIGHLPGCGPYAWDSWRIFCRDVLRGVAEDYNGKGAATAGFEPEWKRVVPLDKELRAFLRWMWLREGWVWDPLTGKKRRADEETMSLAREGGDMIENDGDGVRIGLASQGWEPVANEGDKATVIIDLPYEPSKKEKMETTTTKTHTRRTRSNSEY